MIVGSNHNKKYSSSYQIAEILQGMFATWEGIHSEILHLGDFDVRMCKGCCRCFEYGECNIQDDMVLLKERMLKADHLIFISPVYAHNVTGLLKNYIDRSSNWLHILGLLGKTSSSVVVSSSNGNVYVSDYLRKLLEFYGTIYLGNMNITVDEPQMLNNIDDMKIIIKKYLDKIILFDRNHIDMDLVEKQSGLFQSFKKMYCSDKIKKGHEKEMWMNNECLQKNSFIEAYEHKKYMEKMYEKAD